MEDRSGDALLLDRGIECCDENSSGEEAGDCEMDVGVILVFENDGLE